MKLKLTPAITTSALVLAAVNTVYAQSAILIMIRREAGGVEFSMGDCGRSGVFTCSSPFVTRL